MTGLANFVLDHPWAFLLLLAMTVLSIVGIIAIGAWLLVPPPPAEDPRAAALRSLRDMHPGPRSIP